MVIAERLSARQLILLCISFCIYLCVHIYYNMSIMLRNANFLYTACAEVRCVYTAALLLSACHSAQVLEYDGSTCTMDNRPYQG